MANTTEERDTSQLRLTKENLRQFTGDDIRFSHSLNRNVIYTPGIQFVAEAGQAYWMLDAIASYYGSHVMKQAIESDYRLESLQFWRLDVTNGSAVLTMRADCDCKAAIRQEFLFTDFPLNQVDIWAGFDGLHWTLYLPSEH